MKIPIVKSFRFIHEPLRHEDEALGILGNDELIGELQSRIAHSRGGAFLITGFRGVGKSTLVLRALEAISHAPGDQVIVPVILSVARSTSTDRLLFAVIRRTFETLNASGHLNELPPETRHSLLLAYIRTSLSFKEAQNNSSEQTAGLDLGSVTAAAGLNVIPKLGMSMKRSRSLATEASFLAYSETDVEYDLTRIISLLNETRPQPVRSRGRFPWLRRPRPHVPSLHLIIVLDEVDKLTAGESGLTAVEDLLGGVKNVLTATGAHFLLVAGTDMHDRAVRDASRGNSVYESVFAWRMYVPCLWDAPQKLISSVVDSAGEAGAGGSERAEVLADFTDYLKFKARGVTRRLLQEFNSFVTWEDGRPYLEIDDSDRARIAFYARLEGILAAYYTQGHRGGLFPLAVDNDRRRLGIYYLMESILRTGGEPFNAADLLTKEHEHDLDPLLRVSERGVERLLTYLAERRLLEVVHEVGAGAVVVEDVAAVQQAVYRLADDIQATILGIAMYTEVERAQLDLSLSTFTGVSRFTGGPPSRDVSESGVHSGVFLRQEGGSLQAGRYELEAVLGQGGMGRVYRGRDRLLGREVAIKLLPANLLQDTKAMARFRREADIASRVEHERIVRTYELMEDPERGLGLVMELLSGDTLQETVEKRGPLSGRAAASLGRELAGALEYLEHQGLARFDLKPSNIILEPGRGPVIIDFGIARHVEPDTLITDHRMLVGTPQYMAPEQVTGEPVEIRADIYALGQVLYFCLEGRTPWHDLSMIHIMARLITDDVDVSALPVSPEFRAVLGRALARRPDKRYQHPAELREALGGLPELNTCPECAESVDAQMRFCENCGYDLFHQ